jgi:hypothetical protein
MDNQNIQGCSGCTIKIQDGVFTKIAPDNYKERLLKQGFKQNQYTDIIKIPGIKIPSINEIRSNSISMEYFPLPSFPNFIERADKQEIDWAIDILINYIDREMNSCTQVDTTAIWNLKVNDLILEDVKEYLTMDRLVLPVGLCHGDLTLANMLVDNYHKEIILIDFLDSFIDSPLIDMVKLKQDTIYRWVYLRANKQYDNCRAGILLNYIDTRLEKAWEKYPIYKELYSKLQVMNLARIVPYVDTNTKQLLQSWVLKLMGESNV